MVTDKRRLRAGAGPMLACIGQTVVWCCMSIIENNNNKCDFASFALVRHYHENKVLMTCFLKVSLYKHLYKFLLKAGQSLTFCLMTRQWRQTCAATQTFLSTTCNCCCQTVNCVKFRQLTPDSRIHSNRYLLKMSNYMFCWCDNDDRMTMDSSLTLSSFYYL